MKLLADGIVGKFSDCLRELSLGSWAKGDDGLCGWWYCGLII